MTTNNHPLRRETSALFKLAIPLMLSQLAQMGMNLTDTIMAGRHSETSLAGVAIGSSFWVPAFLFLVGVLMAITPMVAQSFGAKKPQEIREHVQQGFWLALALGLPMLLALQWSSQAFHFMEMEEETRTQAIGYATAVAFGLPALAGFQVLRGLNEGMQFTKPYLIVSILALAVNIPLNYVLIYGKFGLPELGGVGCGWATAIVLWLELLLMYLLSRRNKTLDKTHWHSQWQKPHYAKIKEILGLGIPIGVALLVESSMFALIALFLAQLGSTVVAGHQVAMSIISVLFMIPLSLSMALTIRCGFHLGEQNPALARYIGFLGIGYTLVIAILFSAIILLGSPLLAAIYSNNPEVREIAIELLFLAAIFQFSDALQISAAGALRGYKDTRYTFLVVVIAYWVIALPLGYVLGLTDFLIPAKGAVGFWMSLIAGLAVASILLVLRYHNISKLSDNPVNSP